MESCAQSVYKAKSDLMFSDFIQTAFFPGTISGWNYHIFWDLHCYLPLNNIEKTVLIWKICYMYDVKAVQPLGVRMEAIRSLQAQLTTRRAGCPGH